MSIICNLSSSPFYLYDGVHTREDVCTSTHTHMHKPTHTNTHTHIYIYITKLMLHSAQIVYMHEAPLLPQTFSNGFGQFGLFYEVIPISNYSHGNYCCINFYASTLHISLLIKTMHTQTLAKKVAERFSFC